MVMAVVGALLTLAVLLRLLATAARTFVSDLNFLGSEIGLGIASVFMRPIRREQAWMAGLDEVFPNAVLPLMGDFTSWRYVPMVGVTARADGVRHREIDKMHRVILALTINRW